MSIQRLEQLKEQLEYVVEIDNDVVKTYRIVQNDRFRSIMQKHMKKMKSFVFVIKKQVDIELNGKLKPATDEEFAFMLGEITKQVGEAVDNWNKDKERMGAA
jgi:hypothetical protein